MKHVIVGTAGHIDHGKTELVRALTGVDCDRLAEEKARGITIDIGFASLRIGEDLVLGFVDVPGHERFVKNMLAGATGVDVVVLVVAADESIKPQTREHLDICRLLGIPRGVVALTKIDLADEETREIAAMEIRELVAGTFLEGAPLVPVSSRTGEGIEELKSELAASARAARPRPVSTFLRLPVDRAFSMRGFGIVVTGTLAAGEVGTGDAIAVYPAGVTGRVRGIQVHSQSVPRAVAGQRTALNLQGLDAVEVSRGCVLAPPGTMRPSSLLDAEITLLPGSPAALKDLARVRFHHGTRELLARVKLLDRGQLEAGQTAFAQVRLEAPGLALPGDRFVLRRYSPMVTIGGGLVLDGHPAKRRGGETEGLRDLERLRGGGHAALILHALAGAPSGLTAADLVVRTGLAPAEAARLAAELCERGDAVAAGDRSGPFIHASRHAGHREDALRILGEFHAAKPLMMGLPREELLRRMAHGEDLDAARFALDSLAADGKVRLDKDLAALSGHHIALNPEEDRIMTLLESRFRDAGLNPCSLEEIVGEAGLDAQSSRRIYHLLLSRGRLVRIKDGKVFHAEAIEALKASLWKLRERKPVIDVATFKELTGTSRKNAIPLLEHLDAQKVTRRRGNDREILPPVRA